MTPNDLLSHWKTYNTLNQAPCETAVYLAAECHDGGMFSLSPMLFGSPTYRSPFRRIYNPAARCGESLLRPFRFERH